MTVVSLAVGAVGAVVAGVVFKLAQDSARTDAQTLSANPGVNCTANPLDPICPQIADKKDAYDRDRVLTVVFFGAGAALAAGALATAALLRNEHAAPLGGSRLVPVVSAGGASLVWTGHF